MQRPKHSVLTQSYQTLPLGGDTPILQRKDARHNTFTDMSDHSLKAAPYIVQSGRQQDYFKPQKVDQATETEVDLLDDLQTFMSAKFTLMLQVHKEVILDLLHNDTSHDTHLKKLTHELTGMRLHNARLQLENRHLSEMLIE
mmetsp:Transcript_29282/g.52425  ORF Transcript_29282/g.52425 Transcript_29282/m.52425 type:complete len:142 (+) Transcript_29282:24-449(+)